MNQGKFEDYSENEETELSPDEINEALEDALEIDTQTQVFLEMRKQNLELLKIAAQVAGFAGPHPPIKSGDVKNALRNIWEIYSEVYTWVDPEETEEDEDGEFDEQDD
jgi:hypothetical protein